MDAASDIPADGVDAVATGKGEIVTNYYLTSLAGHIDLIVYLHVFPILYAFILEIPLVEPLIVFHFESVGRDHYSFNAWFQTQTHFE